MGGACTAPNPIQWTAILFLIAGAGVFALTTGVGVVAIANIMVPMILAGASVDSIIGSISGYVVVTTGGAEGLGTIIIAIMGLLGC